MTPTSDLLEHYLRATGWERGERGWWCRGAWELGTFDGMTDINVDLQIHKLAAANREPSSLTAFRLGMCATAEEMMTDATAWTLTADELTRDGAHQLATYARAQASMISEYVQRHLRAAGIDPAAWEKARRP